MQPVQPPVNPDSSKSSIANLHEILSLLDMKADQAEIQKQQYGDSTRKLIMTLQRRLSLQETDGFIGETTARKLNELLKEKNGFPTENKFKVIGHAFTNKGVPLGSCRIIAYQKQLAGETVLGQTVTDKLGAYSILYNKDPKKDSFDIEIAVADNRNEKKIIGRSAVRYNAGQQETIDVMVLAANWQPASEYERLLADLQPHLEKTTLKDVEESRDKQQVSYLSNKTGWDPRLVAMAVQAHKLQASLKFEPSHIYALYRAGVPNSQTSFMQLDAETVEKTLKKAMETHIIQEAGNINDTIGALSSQTSQHLLNTVTSSAVSSMGTMLALRLNADQQQVFAKTIQETTISDTKSFWGALSNKGFTEETIKQLQFDGKLGYLTGQNAPLVKKVYEKYQVNAAEQLVQKGLYKADEWKTIIGTDIPKGFTADEYATQLANGVRLSFPTSVAAEMIHNKEIKIGANGSLDEVYQFFQSNQGKNNIGSQPVKTWEGFNQLSSEAKSASKKMERLYQMTPSDDSMIALANAGFDSAYQVAATYSKEEFLQKYGDRFPSIDEAELTYKKASEIHSSVLNLATNYLSTRSMPNVYAITGKSLQPNGVQPTELFRTAGEANMAMAPNDAQSTIANPTLEELFGNMDYCACDHCKSVLSPAAYLVELLQFIDLTGKTFTKQNPITVLFNRRPDIQHIQLTCENTSVSLPYIDLVNEILEHYIINGNLTALKDHDFTEHTKQSELLAEPQFVSEAAYDELKKKVYPYHLPFSYSLEALRLLFGMWDNPLQEALHVFASALGSRKETLLLNEEEYKTLTDRAFKQVPEYFGEAPALTIAAMNMTISDGKTFSRRMDISYDELSRILKTHFINPGITLVPLLEKLNISLVDLNDYFNGTLSDAQMDAKIPSTIDPADYGEDVKQWLKNNETLIMELITLTDTGSGSEPCNMAAVQLRYALPDNNANQLKVIAYHKLHRFIRLVKKTGWKIETLDKAIEVCTPVPSKDIDENNIDGIFVTLLNRLANIKKTAGLLSVSDKKLPELLQLWDTSIEQSVREEQCAKYLKVRIPDMRELSQITGIDPLTNDLEKDSPSFLQLLELTKELKTSSFKTDDLNYIVRNKDENNHLIPSESSWLKTCKLLRDTLTVVQKENSIAQDNADFAFVKAKMALVYDAQVTEHFFGLLTDSNTYATTFNTVEEGLPAKLTSVDAQLGFDPFKKELSYQGILSNAQRLTLSAKADELVLSDMDIIQSQSDLNSFITGIKAAFQQLTDDADTDLGKLATDYPELKTIYDAVKTKPDPASQTKELLDSILPELIAKLKNTVTRQILTTVLKTDADTINALTDKKEVLSASSDNTKTSLFDFLRLEKEMDFALNQVYRFYLDPLATDDYLFYAAAPENTSIHLIVNSISVINNAVVPAAGEVKSSLTSPLTAGSLYYCELTITNLPVDEQVVLSWRTKGMAKIPIPATSLYEHSQTTHARNVWLRLLKSVSLKSILKLSSAELSYFASDNSETKDILNRLDIDGSISGQGLKDQWNRLKLLIYFACLKKENGPEENTWLQVLQDPNVITAQGNNLLEGMHDWKEADLTAVLLKLGTPRSELSKLSVVKRIMQAMNIVTAIGYPASDVLTWISASPDFNLITNIKKTIKENITEAVWLETIPTVSDPLRNKVRDALVSYILQYKRPSPEINTANKLYEYFLVDVEMDACMKTSRIRLALSTVQLFIQRCLMNLEPDVAPASITANQWPWMSRYRVWEANRKVYLNPENYVFEELRDNKSPFFKELEGELLQSEITDESAELAFLNYLKKLDDVARLEIVGMHLEKNQEGNQYDDVLHVIGRTNGNTRQYYYRRYEPPGSWTPWEKISLNIEGEYVFPVIWKKRLFLFWLNAWEQEAKPDTSNISPSANVGNLTVEQANRPPLKTIQISMSWGELYKGKWTSPKSTDPTNPLVLENLSRFKPGNFLIYVRTEKPENKSERLIFHIIYIDGKYIKPFRLTYTTKNAPPIIENSYDSKLTPDVAMFNYWLYRSAYKSPVESILFYNHLLTSGKDLTNAIAQPANAASTTINEALVTKKNNLFPGFRLLTLRHPVENQHEAPFFYLDERSTFYVQSNEEVFTPLGLYDGYYHVDLYPAKSFVELKEIPVLVEKPIPGWPPIDVKMPGIEEVINDPWTWNEKSLVQNANISKVMPVDKPFTFGDTVFGSGGKVPGSLNDMLNINISNF